MVDVRGHQDGDGTLEITLGEDDILNVYLNAYTTQFHFKGNGVSVRLHSETSPMFTPWIELDLDKIRADHEPGHQYEEYEHGGEG